MNHPTHTNHTDSPQKQRMCVGNAETRCGRGVNSVLFTAVSKGAKRSDHLGSASWITDTNSTGIQSLLYMPFGEPLSDNRSASYNSRYTFSGKERDTETGYSYFGARYYNSDLSIWLSVDPMADKYPGLSPYAYCANNPVKLVDEDGMEIGSVDEASQAKINALTDKNSPEYSRAFTRKYHRLERSKQTYNFIQATEANITTDVIGKVQSNENGSIDIIHSSINSTRTSEKGGFSKKYATLFEETYHAVDYDKGRLDLNNPTCRDEAHAWKFAAKAPGTKVYYSPSSYTFAGSVLELSTRQLTNHFKDGQESFYDSSTGMVYYLMNSYTGGGLYKHLPRTKRKID